MHIIGKFQTDTMLLGFWLCLLLFVFSLLFFQAKVWKFEIKFEIGLANVLGFYVFNDFRYTSDILRIL